MSVTINTVSGTTTATHDGDNAQVFQTSTGNVTIDLAKLCEWLTELEARIYALENP